MKCPSVATLTRTFRDLSAEQAGLIKRICRAADDGAELEALLTAECPQVFQRSDLQLGGIPNMAHMDRAWLRTYALRALDCILDTHGVEAIVRESDSVYSAPFMEYLNTGDTYATTLLYFRDSDALRIGSWGDVVERMGL